MEKKISMWVTVTRSVHLGMQYFKEVCVWCFGPQWALQGLKEHLNTQEDGEKPGKRAKVRKHCQKPHTHTVSNVLQFKHTPAMHIHFCPGFLIRIRVNRMFTRVRIGVLSRWFGALANTPKGHVFWGKEASRRHIIQLSRMYASL